MAARPTWKGYLKVSLVNVPIRVFPATDAAASVSFNQLHVECQSRIQQKKWCPVCDRELSKDEIVRGYQFAKNQYVIIEDEDIAKVRPESTKVIDLKRFTEVAEIDPIYFERPYYLAPDGNVAAEAFAVIREGMKGKAGIGKLAISGREYLVAVQPRGKGLVMFTMRQADEIRSMSAIDELDRVPDTVSPDEVRLAEQVIGNFEGELNLSDYRDEYEAQLREIIDAKVAGREVVAPAEEVPEKVVDLMEALRRSLDSVSKGKKTPVRAATAKPVARSGRKRTRKAG